jgi:hypothetical protein
MAPGLRAGCREGGDSEAVLQATGRHECLQLAQERCAEDSSTQESGEKAPYVARGETIAPAAHVHQAGSALVSTGGPVTTRRGRFGEGRAARRDAPGAGGRAARRPLPPRSGRARSSSYSSTRSSRPRAAAQEDARLRSRRALWRPPSFVIAQDAIILDVVEEPGRVREQIPHRDRPPGRGTPGSQRSLGRAGGEDAVEQRPELGLVATPRRGAAD